MSPALQANSFAEPSGKPSLAGPWKHTVNSIAICFFTSHIYSVRLSRGKELVPAAPFTIMCKSQPGTLDSRSDALPLCIGVWCLSTFSTPSGELWEDENQPHRL